MADEMTDGKWVQLSQLISDTTGLHFPGARRADLHRGMVRVAHDLGFDDIGRCVDWLVSVPAAKVPVGVLARHLTVGETYFFRDRATFLALADSLVPDLLRARRGRCQRLRFWSAACCTGEEAYSLAILLHQTIPDLADWEVTILATDLNAEFLASAVAASYGPWSFRDVPPETRARYFRRTADKRYTLLPEIRKMVRFEPLNLVADGYPSMAPDTNAMDFILCRNALMYFEPSRALGVIGKLHDSLVEGGWLVVSPSEASLALFSRFATVNSPGAILFRKPFAGSLAEQAAISAPAQKFSAIAPDAIEPIGPAISRMPSAGSFSRPLAPFRESMQPEVRRTLHAEAEFLYRNGQYREAARKLLPLARSRVDDPPTLSLLTRSLANIGELDEALNWSNCWTASNRLDPASYYLRAVILLEQGEVEAARTALQQSVYLEPGFVLAYFALGNLARSTGQLEVSHRHFSNALRLLRSHEPADTPPESDGLTAARLLEVITSTMPIGVAQ